MKKLLCLLLCLMLPVAAMAAPMRAMRDSVLSEAELATMRSWLDGVVRDALPLQYDNNTYVGAYVYSCVEDGGCYVLECDVYLEEGGDSLPEFAADNALTWLCDATVCVKRNGNEYELVSVEAGDYYAATAMKTTVNTEKGFEVSLPDTFVPAADGVDYSYSEEDKVVATVTYRFEEAKGTSLADYAKSLGGEGMIVDVNEDLAQATAQAAGMYLVICAGEDGFHSLTLSYPAEREAEFTLYAEFMRNSFVVSGQSNG